MQLASNTPGQYVMQVSELTMQIKSVLESDFNYVEVEGEISGYKLHDSGHIYFNLKDSSALLACTLFRGNAAKQKIQLKNGDKIIAKGNISVYAPKGGYSLNVLRCEYSGLGDLKQQFERLKKELESKGYFAKNKPLPRFPKRVILITSRSGAALQDMIKVASKRFCACEFILLDTLVQGREAKFCIAKNLNFADNLGADIIVLARGGGSIEDLWSFNEIEVLESIYACKTPVVSAIGHEIDYLLSDYVADVRAPTPSAAMEMILPDIVALTRQLIDFEETLNANFSAFMSRKRQILAHLNKSIEILNPQKKLQNLTLKTREYATLLQDSMQILLNYKRQELRNLKSHLEILKPINKIPQIRQRLQTLSVELNESALKMLHSKGKESAFISQNLNQTFKLYLNQKRANLQSLNEIIKNINPQNRLQKGFVQILKDDKIMQVSELKSGDKIELVDSSGMTGAIVE